MPLRTYKEYKNRVSNAHREFVGGDYERIGKLQYHWIISNGVLPTHKFLDVACGSLRLGQYLIPYLQEKNYYGIDKEKEAIMDGIDKEFYFNIIDKKQPTFESNADFNMKNFPTMDFGIAQSLFTHLTPVDIEKCLRSLKKVGIREKFWFTFHETNNSVVNPVESNSFAYFAYTKKEIEHMCKVTDWKCNIIGEWHHPKNQQIVEITN